MLSLRQSEQNQDKVDLFDTRQSQQTERLSTGNVGNMASSNLIMCGKWALDVSNDGKRTEDADETYSVHSKALGQRLLCPLAPVNYGIDINEKEKSWREMSQIKSHLLKKIPKFMSEHTPTHSHPVTHTAH